MALRAVVGVMGCGTVGSKVIHSLIKMPLYEEGKLVVVAVASSKKMILCEKILDNWSDLLKSGKCEDNNREKFVDHLEKFEGVRVLVDCTNILGTDVLYRELLTKRNINVVTCNKKAFSDDFDKLVDLVTAERNSRASIGFESTVWYIRHFFLSLNLASFKGRKEIVRNIFYIHSYPSWIFAN